MNSRCVPRDECPSLIGNGYSVKLIKKFIVYFFTVKLLHAAASSEPGTVETDKKTKDEESVDDKEKDSTPDPSPDNKNKTKPIAGELYRVTMWRSR